MALQSVAPNPALGVAGLLKEPSPVNRTCCQFFKSGWFSTPTACSGPLASGPLGNKTLEAWVKNLTPVPSTTNDEAIGRYNVAIYDWGGDSCFYDGTNIAHVNQRLADKQIHHLVATYIPGGLTTMWTDGVIDWTYTSANNDSTIVSHPWQIGGVSSTSQGWNGFLQHIAVYTGLLSSHRIRQHYRIGKGYEEREASLSDSLFVPNGSCPQQGSFDVKNGYPLFYGQLQSWGGVVTADVAWLDTLRKSGYFTESVAP